MQHLFRPLFLIIFVTVQIWTTASSLRLRTSRDGSPKINGDSRGETMVIPRTAIRSVHHDRCLTNSTLATTNKRDSGNLALGGNNNNSNPPPYLRPQRRPDAQQSGDIHAVNNFRPGPDPALPRAPTGFEFDPNNKDILLCLRCRLINQHRSRDCQYRKYCSECQIDGHTNYEHRQVHQAMNPQRPRNNPENSEPRLPRDPQAPPLMQQRLQPPQQPMRQNGAPQAALPQHDASRNVTQ